MIRLDGVGHQKQYHKQVVTLTIIVNVIVVLFMGFINYKVFTSPVNTNHDKDIILFSDVLIFGTLLFVTLKPAKNEITITGGNENIVLYGNVPDEKTVNEFVDLLIKASNEYFLERYGKIDPDMPKEMMMIRLSRLRDRELINEEEFEKLNQQYKSAQA